MTHFRCGRVLVVHSFSTGGASTTLPECVIYERAERAPPAVVSVVLIGVDDPMRTPLKEPQSDENLNAVL